MTRFVIRSLRAPIYHIAPIIWCGMEWLRKNCLGGFSFASLEHSQYQNILVIQVADLIGEYGLGMLIVLVGTCLSSCIIEFCLVNRASVLKNRLIRCLWPFSLVSLAIIFIVSYGYGRMQSVKNNDDKISPVRIALLQGDFVPKNEFDNKFSRYEELTRRIAESADLIVWPESALPISYSIIDSNFVPAGWENESRDAIDGMLAAKRNETRKFFCDFSNSSGVPLLLGGKVKQFGVPDNAQKILQY